MPIPQRLRISVAKSSLLLPSTELPFAMLRHIGLKVTGTSSEPGDSWQPMTDRHAHKEALLKVAPTLWFRSYSKAHHWLRLKLNSSSSPSLPSPASLIPLLLVHSPSPERSPGLGSASQAPSLRAWVILLPQDERWSVICKPLENRAAIAISSKKFFFQIPEFFPHSKYSL